MFKRSARCFEIPNSVLARLITGANGLLKEFIDRRAAVSVGYRIVRQVIDAVGPLQFATLRYLNGAWQRFRQLACEDTPHLIGRTHVEVRSSIAQAVLIADSLPRPDTQQHIMGARVIRH